MPYWNDGIRTIAPRLGLGFGSGSRLVLGLEVNQTIAPRLGLGFGLEPLTQKMELKEKKNIKSKITLI